MGRWSAIPVFPIRSSGIASATTAPPSTGSVSWRDAAVGAAFEAEEAVAGLLATAGRVAVSPARRSADLATHA